MEAFVITLREGVEAALVIGLILAYLKRTGRAALNHYVYAGLLLAVLASVAGAAGLSAIGLNPENEVLEGTLQAVTAVLVATLVIWMWRASRSMKRQVEHRLEALTAEDGRRQGLGLLGFAFFMVFREGIETVLFLAAVTLTVTGGLVQVIGGATGLGLAVLFGFLLVRGSLRINLGRFFGLTSLVLLVLVVRLLAGSVHEFSEAGLLPTTPAMLAVVGFIVKDSVSIVILIALVLLPGVAMLPSLRRLPGPNDPRPDEGLAERRRRLAATRRARRWQMGTVGVTVAVVLPLAWSVYTAEMAGIRPQPAEVTPQGEEFRVATHDMEPGELYKFLHHGAQADVRFIVIKRGDGDFAVALDACSICPPVGYHQDGDTIHCDNCNAPINTATIGLPGGCNPIPLPFSIHGDELVIGLGNVEAAQFRFAR